VAGFPKARLVVPTPTAIYYYSISPALPNGLSFNKETGT
jgi:hypothetical protein